MNVIELETLAEKTLAMCEANVVIMGYGMATGRLFVEPRWECDLGREALAARVVACGIAWADANGAGDFVCSYAKRDEPQVG